MESKKINQLATELTPALSDLTIIGDPTTGISKKITLSQMASLFTGTVEEYANLASFPLVGAADTIYIALDTNIIYRWNTSTSAYVELSPNIVTSLVFSDANGFDGTISLVGSTATLTITTALTQGSVPFIGTSGALSQDNANLFFDDTNNRLGINTNSPTTALDVFGSGIIGRINGTSTNNAFLGFASAGTNKWSIGNVQSDHRFRIYNEATTSELVSVLQTGEFGIGIANPTTKLHIDGGASALIANLDANVSVAKSISFRSDNSARINLEVSGTESGSNTGADLFIRRYSDAGALIDTPFSITRSTGVVNIGTTGALTYFGTSNTTDKYISLLNSGGNFDIGTNSTTHYLNTSGTNPFKIFVNSTTAAMTILSGNNIGFGTATPGAQVVIASTQNNTNNYPWLTFRNLSAGYGTWGFYKSGSNDLGLAFSTSVDTPYENQTSVLFKYGGDIQLLNASQQIVNLRATNGTGGLTIQSGATADYNGGPSITFVSSDRNGQYTRGEMYISAGRATNSTSNGFISVYTSDTERLKFTSDGYLRLMTSSGIQFNGDTSAANALNDYEEGLFVTSAICTTSGTITLRSDYDTLSYVKIGSIVHVSGLLAVSSVSSPTGAIRINLPFQCANLGDGSGTATGSVVVNATVSTNSIDFTAWVDELTSYVVIYRGDSVSPTSNSAQQIKAATDFYLQITYRTA